MAGAGGAGGIIQMILPLIMGLINKGNAKGQQDLQGILGNQDLLQSLAGQQLGIQNQTAQLESLLAGGGGLGNILGGANLGGLGGLNLGGSTNANTYTKLFESLAEMNAGANSPDLGFDLPGLLDTPKISDGDLLAKIKEQLDGMEGRLDAIEGKDGVEHVDNEE